MTKTIMFSNSDRLILNIKLELNVELAYFVRCWLKVRLGITAITTAIKSKEMKKTYELFVYFYVFHKSSLSFIILMGNASPTYD